jgi:hypothetical protein
MNQSALMLNTLMPLSILATENHGHFTNLSNGNGNGGNNMTNNMTNGGNNNMTNGGNNMANMANNMANSGDHVTTKKDMKFGVLIILLLIIIFQILPVMLIAVNCNPKSPVLYGIISFLFPGIYILQHAVRKYLMKENGYCGNK